MEKGIFCLVGMLCLFAMNSKGQDIDSTTIGLAKLPQEYYSKVDKKIGSIDVQLSKKLAKYLSKFEKKELKIRKKLRKIDPDNVVASADEKYRGFLQKLKTSSSGGVRGLKGRLPNKSPPAESEEISNTSITGEYNPYLDSLNTSLSFLNQLNGVGDKAKEPLANLHSLESKLQQSEKIKEFIAERRNQLKEALSKYTKIPKGLKSQYDKLSKTAYYYSAQVKEYKDMLKDPEKIERKALSLLNKLPAFQKFMKQNGQLASLFGIPENYGSPQALTGLQTREMVQTMISNRIGGGTSAAQIFSQQVQVAQNSLTQFKDKLTKLGGGSGDIEMPDFKPNSQKTKPFLKRLEYGFNTQFTRTNSLLPSTSDIGLSVGYKINDKSTIGLGLSYKIGLGTIEHIHFTSQGLGLRSFLDWKLKGKIFLTGGCEYNYNSAFKNIQQLSMYEAWQKSALIGLSRKYSIGKKRKGEVKVLYDFLANNHIPRSQALLFRVGYIMK